MIVRFGFVAMSMRVKNASPSKNMTEKTLKQIGNRELAAKKVIRLAKENLNNTKRILYHAIAHDIRLYRFSSRLIPLATHPAFQKVDFVRVLVPQLREIGQIVRENGMRVGFHPEHFTVLNSPRPEVIRSSVKDLIRHIRMLRAMGLDEAYKCNIHVGGAYGDKEVSAKRFITTFRKLDPRIQAHICLENDDTTFTARETLEIAQTVGVPCVLDLHHHQLNHNRETLEELWPQIAQTWSKERFPPKIHVSSPRSESDPKSHADHVHPDDLVPFLRLAAGYGERLDIMIEAKRKDEALFRLMEELAKTPRINRIDQATIEVEK
jgi:UV DNA damage endonuclease